MIPVTLLEFTIEGVCPLDLGANPGSSVRGALYETLAAMYDTGTRARSRHDTESNPVAWLLRLEDAEKTGGKDAPRPLALRPPRAGDGAQTAFTIALYGRGRDAAGMIVSAVASMGGVGIGRNHQKFTLRRVRSIDPLTTQGIDIVDETGRQIAELPVPPTTEAYARFAGLLTPNALTVRFLTPTRIVEHGKLCHHPIFRAWFQRLIERIRQVSELYADPVWIPFHDLLEAAESVQLTDDGTRWQELWSHSRYDGMYKPVSGFVGSAVYTGDLRVLLPYLLLGQALQIGKNTIKGCGWYEIEYRWW